MKLIIIMWITVIIAGFSWFYFYHQQPGDYLLIDNYEEVLSKYGLGCSGRSLIFFIHPKCPCTKSSVYELKNILRKNNDIVTTIVFSIPNKLSNYQQLINRYKEDFKKINSSNLNFLTDYNLDISKDFGSLTSGYTLYFEGRDLKFSGGITPSRAHIGKTEGHTVICNNRNDTQINSEVYGCSLNSLECKKPQIK